MVATTTHFPKQKAPCGHMVDGDHHIERDDEGLAYDDLKFSCGCREIRHFYTTDPCGYARFDTTARC